MEADWAFGTRSMEFTSSSMRSLNTQIKAELALPPLTQERTLAQIFPKYHRNCNTRRGSSHRGHFQHCPSFSTEFFQFHLLATEEDLAHWVRGYLESARWFLHYWLLVICNETKHTTKTPQLMPVYHLGKQSKLSEWTLLICQHIFETKKRCQALKNITADFPAQNYQHLWLCAGFPWSLEQEDSIWNDLGEENHTSAFSHKGVLVISSSGPAKPWGLLPVHIYTIPFTYKGLQFLFVFTQWGNYSGMRGLHGTSSGQRFPPQSANSVVQMGEPNLAPNSWITELLQLCRREKQSSVPVGPHQTCSVWCWPIQSTGQFCKNRLASVTILVVTALFLLQSPISAIFLRASLWSSELM